MLRSAARERVCLLLLRCGGGRAMERVGSPCRGSGWGLVSGVVWKALLMLMIMMLGLGLGLRAIWRGSVGRLMGGVGCLCRCRIGLMRLLRGGMLGGS